MPNCEMCGNEQDSLTTVKIEGAELDVCDSCAELGTPVNQGAESEQSGETSTTSGGQSNGRSSTSSSSGTSSHSTTSTSSGRTGYAPSSGELVHDYEDKIQKARQRSGMNRAELADKINEKESLVARLENGRSLPSEEVRQKLEQALDINLLAEGGEE